MKGRKRLSEDATHKISYRLKLKTKEAKYFSQLCTYERCRSPELKSVLQEQLGGLAKTKLIDLEVDAFRTLSEWYHAALIAACDLTGGVTTQKAARLLGLSLPETVAAVERLKRLGFIDVDVTGNLSALEVDFQLKTQKPNLALQEFTRQIFRKADESQVEQSNEERVFGTETFAIDEKDLPKLKELSDEYLDNIVKLAKKSRKKSHVYSAGVQIFRLSKKEPL